MTIGPSGRAPVAEQRDAVLVEVDRRGAPILSRVTLPEGDRAESRLAFVLDALASCAAPCVLAIVDLGGSPDHLYLVMGEADAQGRLEITEGAEHRRTARGAAALVRIETFLKGGEPSLGS